MLKPLLPSSLCMSQTSGMKLTWNLVKFLSKMVFWTHSLIPSNSTYSKALQAKWKVFPWIMCKVINHMWKFHSKKSVSKYLKQNSLNLAHRIQTVGQNFGLKHNKNCWPTVSFGNGSSLVLTIGLVYLSNILVM